jgi:hypothetical protein
MALHYRDARLWKSRHDAQRASVLVECARAETARRRDGAAGGRAAVRRRRAAASAGAAVSPALALAQQTVGAAAFTCGGCGTWLFRANDMVDDTRRECDVALTDSVATVCECCCVRIWPPVAAYTFSPRACVCVCVCLTDSRRPLQVSARRTLPSARCACTSARAQKHGNSRRAASRAHTAGYSSVCFNEIYRTRFNVSLVATLRVFRH